MNRFALPLFAALMALVLGIIIGRYSVSPGNAGPRPSAPAVFAEASPLSKPVIIPQSAPGQQPAEVTIPLGSNLAENIKAAL
ncbi:MAG TPA: hypothetical protein VGG94_02050, partial [Chthoniobacterales bacterium]